MWDIPILIFAYVELGFVVFRVLGIGLRVWRLCFGVEGL